MRSTSDAQDRLAHPLAAASSKMQPGSLLSCGGHDIVDLSVTSPRRAAAAARSAPGDTPFPPKASSGAKVSSPPATKRSHFMGVEWPAVSSPPKTKRSHFMGVAWDQKNAHWYHSMHETANRFGSLHSYGTEWEAASAWDLAKARATSTMRLTPSDLNYPNAGNILRLLDLTAGWSEWVRRPVVSNPTSPAGECFIIIFIQLYD